MPAGLLCALLLTAAPLRAEEVLLRTASGHTGAVLAAAYSPDGTKVLTGGEGTLNLWDARTGKELAYWAAHEGWVRGVAFSPDGRKALSGGDDKLLRLWDLVAGGPAKLWDGHLAAVRAVAFSPDGRKALSGASDKTLRLWDAASGKTLSVWEGHTWNVNAAAFSPDGRKAVSGSLDLSVRIWDVASGKTLASCLGHTAEVLAVAFSPDGKKVLSGGVDNVLRVWDAETGKELATWPGHRKGVQAVAFSPDGMLAASGSRDFSVKLWDTASGKELAVWKGHIGPVNAVAFSPDGSTVVSASDDETVKFWRVPDHAAGTVSVPKPIAPAKVTAQVAFLESTGTDALYGGEKAVLRVSIRNEGPGPAYALRVALDYPATPGLTALRSTMVGTLPAGQSAVKEIPLEASDALPAGKVQVRVDVKEGNGFDAEPQVIEFETRAAIPPKLEVAGLSLAGGIVRAGEITRVEATVRNAGTGPARGVTAKLDISGPDIFPSGDVETVLGDMGPGEAKKVEFQFVVNNRFKGRSLPIALQLAEATGKHGASHPLDLALGQGASTMKVVTVKGKEVQSVPASSPGAEDVDAPPESKTPVDPNAFAVVIGIEKYRQKGIPSVDYAARDAQAMYDYLTRAMGFSEDNAVLLRNEEAGKTDLEKYLGPWLKNRVTRKSRVFVFYAGHGAPNPVSGEGYLIPYDGDPNYTDIAAYPIKRLYETLGKLPSENVLVVMDACFSGQGTRSLLAKGTRPLVNVSDGADAVGENTVVLAATGGSQISTYYPEGQHGLLTYFLLKGLRGEADADKSGKITTEELYDYVKPMVEREARKQNVAQSPTLTPAPKALGGRADQVWLRLK